MSLNGRLGFLLVNFRTVRAFDLCYFGLPEPLGMRVENHLLALSTCLKFCIFERPKNIQTLHSLFKDFGLLVRLQSSSLSPSSLSSPCQSSITPVLGMSLRNVTLLGSNLVSVTNLKDFKFHTVNAVILGVIKPPQLVGQAAEFKFESTSRFEPLPVIWQSLQRLFQKKVIKGSEGKISRQALGAAL